MLALFIYLFQSGIFIIILLPVSQVPILAPGVSLVVYILVFSLLSIHLIHFIWQTRTLPELKWVCSSRENTKNVQDQDWEPVPVLVIKRHPVKIIL